jgi:23S rRNA (adenine2503-C2)-methyltransferase
MGCLFCRTGSLGYTRNLTAHEIVDQFLLLRSYLQRHGHPQSPDPHDRNPAPSSGLSSVVFMGMGEPLANLDNLQRAVEVFTYSGFSPRRITVSSCGLVEGIRSLAERGLTVRLAISLISADSEVRTRLMPINRSNPLPQLRQALVD